MSPTKYAKALAAIVGACAAYAGLEMGEEMIANIALVLTPLVVYLIPNNG